MLALATALPAHAQAGDIQAEGATVADRLGINTHFIAPQPGEMQALAATGVRWVRKDLDWASTEKSPGVYDFSPYDRLLSQFESAKLRTLFILCYYNPLYDHGLSPASDEARQAFAHWVVAAVRHFRGHRILWEIYNEPNFRFWTPRPNTEDYIKLALAVGEAVQETAPDAKLVGPASAAIDPPFLEACFKAGLLNYWSAVSIHTYTPGDPERVANDLLQVRLLMRKYMPPGKVIPVIVTEWGYSAAWNGMDERKQASMLARSWLTQIASGEPLTFWYDWEGGANPQDPEQHYGLIGPPVVAGGSVTFPKKPAYDAVRTLTGMLGDFRFNKRLVLENPNDYLLLFTRGDEVRLAAWTTAPPHQATLPASAGSFQATGVTGESLPALVADRHGLDVMLTNEPQYLAPGESNDLLKVAAAWQRLPEDIEVRSPGELTLRVPVTNPLPKAVRFRARGLNARVQAGPGERADFHQTARLMVRLEAVARSADPVPVVVELEARGLGRLEQSTMLVAENPLRATLLPLAAASLPVLITSPTGDGFRGWVVATHSEGIHFRTESVQLNLAPGSNNATAEIPIDQAPTAIYRAGIDLVDENRNIVLQLPPGRFCRVGDSFSKYRPGADTADYQLETGSGTDTLTAALPAEGSPEPGLGALKLDLKLSPRSSPVSLRTRDAAGQAIPGEPKALGVWIYGDASRALPYLTFVDSTGQRFDEGGGAIDWKGWRYVLVFMDAPQAVHAGGANDGVIHYPIHWQSLFALRNPTGEEMRCVLYVSAPTLIYGPDQTAPPSPQSGR